jgi:hypothetical protein
LQLVVSSKPLARQAKVRERREKVRMTIRKNYMNEVVELRLWRLEADEPNKFKPPFKKLANQRINSKATPAYSAERKHLCFA